MIDETVLIGWAERGLLPDALVRHGIRARLRRVLKALPRHDCMAALDAKHAFLAAMATARVAEVPERANRQHYEVPAAFFVRVLGPQRKYSSGFWPTPDTTLEQAEDIALELTAARAGIGPDMNVLELGCGWGAFTLWAARRFPTATFTAVSNSRTQCAFIDNEARHLGLANVRTLVADMNEFLAPARYDRIVSIEMFEHLRDWRTLFARIHDWLLPDGRFFMHIFCHRAHPYFYTHDDPNDWISHYFFAGGMMPSDDLPLYFQERLKLVGQWRWDGRHYARTLNAWLARLDRAGDITPILRATYGDEVARWRGRWRLFFMACAELFGYARGQEWWVSHYLFARGADVTPTPRT